MKTNSYIALSTPYYSFDPRAKLLFTLLMAAVCFLPSRWEAQCLLTLALLILSLSQIGVKNTLHNLLVILPIIIIMTLLLPLNGRGGEVYFSLFGFDLVTEKAVRVWCRLINRFTFLCTICSLLMETTKTSDLILAMRWYRLPYSAALVLSLALRLIPTFAGSFKEIKDSQSLRLPNPGEEEKKRRGYKGAFPTLISVIVVSVKSISTTSEALELRGYGREGRTSYRKLENVRKVFPPFILSVIVPGVIAFMAVLWR